MTSGGSRAEGRSGTYQTSVGRGFLEVLGSYDAGEPVRPQRTRRTSAMWCRLQRSMASGVGNSSVLPRQTSGESRRMQCGASRASKCSRERASPMAWCKLGEGGSGGCVGGASECCGVARNEKRTQTARIQLVSSIFSRACVRAFVGGRSWVSGRRVVFDGEERVRGTGASQVCQAQKSPASEDPRCVQKVAISRCRRVGGTWCCSDIAGVISTAAPRRRRLPRGDAVVFEGVRQKARPVVAHCSHS